MSWPNDFINVVCARFGTSVLEKVYEKMASMTYSTAFTGIDSPGCASELLAHAVASRLGLPVKGMTHLNGIERNDNCADELAIHPSRPICLHFDQEDFWEPGAAKVLDIASASSKLNFETMLPFIKRAEETIKRSAACRHHPGHLCVFRKASCHIAGTPCVDWSWMGPRTGSEGRTIRAFGAWCAQRRLVQEAIVGMECSDRFDADLLERALGDIYVVNHGKVDPVSLGWPCRRERFWAPLLHKELVSLAVSSWSNVVPLFQRVLQTTWRVFLCADNEDLMSELAWAIGRKKSIACISGHDIEHFKAMRAEEPDKFWKTAFREALSEFEESNLEHYESTVGTDRVHMLGQNPKPPTNRGVSSGSTVLHTIISNAAIQWVCEAGRWLTPTELLVANAIPTTHKHGLGSRCSSFALGGPSRARERKRADVAHQAGNTMNCLVCGVFWMYCLVWTDIADVQQSPDVDVQDVFFRRAK
jgi:hypothetical protein